MTKKTKPRDSNIIKNDNKQTLGSRYNETFPSQSFRAFVTNKNPELLIQTVSRTSWIYWFNCFKLPGW